MLLGADDALRKLDPARLAQLKRRLMSRIVITVEGNAKRVTPVRTGTLRRSITSEVIGTGEKGIVGTNVRYAPTVHRRKPFLTQGLAASRASIGLLLDDLGQELFGG
jgi:hypothetical protein